VGRGGGWKDLWIFLYIFSVVVLSTFDGEVNPHGAEKGPQIVII
jgi:hypothetical protein